MIRLCADAPDGRLLAEFRVPPGNEEKYYLDKELTIPVKEPAYRQIQAELLESVSRILDVYLMLGKETVRVDSLRLIS